MIDLFEIGRQAFTSFIQEFAAYGIEADPAMELKRGQGMLCYYSLEDGHIYLAVPNLNDPVGKLQALMMRSLLGCESNEDLVRFLRMFIPQVLAHELGHHFRHRYGLFGDSLWYEEQVANQLAIAMVKHRLSPEDKAYARQFLRKAIDSLAQKMEAKNIAVDSYYSVLDALNVSGQIDNADFENIQLIQSLLDVDSQELLIDSGQLSPELVQRLEHREDIIEQIDEQYAADAVKYIYYQVVWLYLALTSHETQYVEEFARVHLNQTIDLLPLIEPGQNPTRRQIRACFKAYQDLSTHSTAARYFYKRYRALLLAELQSVELEVPHHTDSFKKEANLILGTWSEQEADTLNYLAHLAPPALRGLFPHTIADHLDPDLDLHVDLPTETDRRLWRHLTTDPADQGVINTLQRLELLDRTDLYRPMPADVMLELAHNLCRIKLAPNETIIWQGELNDDVYILIEGRLQVFVKQNGQDVHVNDIQPGEMFGEVAFFTEEPRNATARAVEPSECFVLKDSDLQLFAYEHPAVLMQMAAVLAKRLTQSYQSNTKSTV
jgi:CRP/FNR family cyclic AMP-dependent transcriptional regulator